MYAGVRRGKGNVVQAYAGVRLNREKLYKLQPYSFETYRKGPKLKYTARKYPPEPNPFVKTPVSTPVMDQGPSSSTTALEETWRESLNPVDVHQLVANIIDDVVTAAVEEAHSRMKGAGTSGFTMSQLSPSVQLCFQSGNPVDPQVVQGERELLDRPITPVMRVEAEGESATVKTPITTPERRGRCGGVPIEVNVRVVAGPGEEVMDAPVNIEMMEEEEEEVVGVPGRKRRRMESDDESDGDSEKTEIYEPPGETPTEMMAEIFSQESSAKESVGTSPRVTRRK